MAKKDLDQEMVFNSYQHASDCKEEAERYLSRVKTSYIFAAITTVLWLICIKSCDWVMNSTSIGFRDFASIIVFITAIGGLVMSIVTYVVGGGVGKAFKIAAHLMALGWVILPFPFDLITGISLFFIAIIALFCVPIIIVFLRHRELNKEIASAEEYMQYCQPVDNTAQQTNTFTEQQESTENTAE